MLNVPNQVPKTDRLKVLATVAILAVGLAMYLGGEQLNGFGRATFQGLGSLIAVAITGGFVYDVFLKDIHRHQTMREVQDQLGRALESALKQSTLPDALASLAASEEALPDKLDDRLRAVLRDEHTLQLERVLPGAFLHGFAGFVPRMQFDQLFKDLHENDELLWFDTYCPDQHEFEQPLREAVRRGAHVRMLAMNPKSDLMALRAREIDEEVEVGYSATDFAENAQRALRSMAVLVGKLNNEKVRGSVVLRTYDDLPCLPMYLVKRNGQCAEGYTSFFLTRPTYHEPHIRWVNGPESRLDCFVAYFERKWEFSLGSEIAAAGPS